MQTDSRLSPFFATKSATLCEVEILTPEGRSYRPDRLLILTDKVMILDYKTGLPGEGHSKQLLQYSQLLKDMGYNNIELYLYYLEDPLGLQRLS